MKRQYIYILTGIGLGLLVAGLFFLYLKSSYSKIFVKANKPLVTTEVLPTATPTPDPKAPYSILLMGYGGGTHQGGLLTDSMMVVRVDPSKEKITLISIPRDLYVPIPFNEEEIRSFKINEAYAIGYDDKKYPNKKIEFTGKAGGGELAKIVVEKVLGFKIDYFVALDFQGFVKTIDILKGIDVKVQKTFDDPMYPLEKDIVDNCGKTDEEVAAITATMSGNKLEEQFMCRYENLHFDKGIVHMDGKTALKYARSRHSPTDGGDFNRAARQRQVVTATKDRIINIGFLPKVLPTIKTLTGNLKTDVDMEKLKEFIGKSAELAKYKISSIALTDQNVLKNGTSSIGQFILIPRTGENNWDEIHQYIENPDLVTITTTPIKN